MMNAPSQPTADQATLWNGPAGRAWVDAQAVLDQVLQPFEDLLIQAVADRRPHHVLDVGCGAGSTTLAVARLLGPNGTSTGIDISQPLITTARDRAEKAHSPARFILADAQTHAFAPKTFDMIISRFGVMFFDDSVRAFANLRSSANDDAELRFLAFRGPKENPFMTTAERAAAPFLPNLPPRKPDAPGQFALADHHRTQSILEESGWAEIDIRPTDVPCSMPEKALVGYLTRLGPLGLALNDADEHSRAQIIKTVRAAFDPFVHGAEVRFISACWMVTARAC